MLSGIYSNDKYAEKNDKSLRKISNAMPAEFLYEISYSVILVSLIEKDE